MINKIITFFILILLFSCGNEAPYISFPIYNIVVYDSGALQMPTESIFLSVYFIISDDDGIDDIKNIKLTHIDTEYSWILENDDLKSVDWENKTYYGYSFFEYNNAKSVLLGDYNIEVEDKVGNIGNLLLRVEGNDSTGDIFNLPPDIPFAIESLDGVKEIKIGNNPYFSTEIKFIDNIDLYNGGRKKFADDEKIVVNPFPDKANGYMLSVKVNQDVNETVIYFLKDFNLR